MSDAFLGEIKMVAFKYAPYGWATCDGQVLPVGQNRQMATLLGAQFGGDGQTNFALPDMGGRIPIHRGQGPGLSSYNIGNTGGVTSVKLVPNQVPKHNHVITASTVPGTKTSPAGLMPAAPDGNPRFQINMYSSTIANRVAMKAGALSPAGRTDPYAHNNMMPYQPQIFVICMQGVYPERKPGEMQA